jgi:hypothetical protein
MLPTCPDLLLLRLLLILALLILQPLSLQANEQLAGEILDLAKQGETRRRKSVSACAMTLAMAWNLIQNRRHSGLKRLLLPEWPVPVFILA